VVSGCIGIAGGAFINYILLELHMHPKGMTSTANLIAFSLSFTTFIQFMIIGSMDYWYGL